MAQWLSEQDEVTRAIHKIAVEAIQDYENAPIGIIRTEFAAEYPDLLRDYGSYYIDTKVVAFLRSEFTVLSKLFSGLYEEFNIRYFDGRLPSCQVKVMHNVDNPDQISDPPERAWIDLQQRELLITYNGWPSNMLTWLVRLMAYFRAGLDRETAQIELHRLMIAGAPTDDEVKRLERVGWSDLSTPPWLPT